MRFLTEVRMRALAPNNRPVRINFDRTQFMFATATLLFAAELDRVNKIRPGRISANRPLSNRIAQVIQHVGIAEKLGLKLQYPITRRDVMFWSVDTGSEADGERASRAMERYQHLIPGPQQRLYGGLTEAMTNCRQHAYDGERGDGFPNALPNWWMFSQYLDGVLCVALCDLGIGIPRSLPKDTSGMWGLIQSMFSKPEDDNDVRRIQAAIRVGATRTLTANRGKGLMEIRSVLDGLGGRMHIHSNRGYYLYDAKKNAAKQEAETCMNFAPESSIQGTVLMWQIPVPKQASS